MIPAVLAVLGFLPLENLHACAVCFGSKDSNIISAYIWGTGILMGATMAILAVAVYVVYRIERLRAQRDGGKRVPVGAGR